MRPLLLALLVCLGAAAPARAEVITFARDPGTSTLSFTLGDLSSWDVATDSLLGLPTGGTLKFDFPSNWPPTTWYGNWRFPTRPTPSKVPEPGTLSLLAIGAVAVFAKRHAERAKL